jgi:hypothetical protein
MENNLSTEEKLAERVARIEENQRTNAAKMLLCEMAAQGTRKERLAAMVRLRTEHGFTTHALWSQIQASFLPFMLVELDSKTDTLLAKNDVLESQALKIYALETELQTWRKSFLFRVWKFFTR